MLARRAYANVAVATLLAVAALFMPLDARACEVDVGQRIVLASMSPDPDVFVWDNRYMLVNYAAGIFDDAKSVMAHTTLAKPGTRAVVVSCVTGAVKPKYVVAAYDAVGIRLTSGPYRGRWGWVASEDTHPIRR